MGKETLSCQSTILDGLMSGFDKHHDLSFMDKYSSALTASSKRVALTKTINQTSLQEPDDRKTQNIIYLGDINMIAEGTA